MITGKSTTNKSYKLGVKYAKEDAEAGMPRRFTYMEWMQMQKRGEDHGEYRPMNQPTGYYASEMERGYQETWKKLKGEQA